MLYCQSTCWFRVIEESLASLTPVIACPADCGGLHSHMVRHWRAHWPLRILPLEITFFFPKRPFEQAFASVPWRLLCTCPGVGPAG